MRIDRLDLLAFGPFTGLSLDFAAPGLHVVYGPNEAGKSTALRAVRDALFEIPARTPDNHTHDYGSLRIGMTLSGGAAAPLSFVRRKGTKNTLLAPGSAEEKGETPLPDDALAPFLGGTTAEAFDRLHGLTLAELSEGSERLLAGGGEVGQLLFAAAGGLSHLRRVRDDLRQEAAALFLGRGRNPVINEGLRELKAIRQEANAEALPPAKWAGAAETLAELGRSRDALKADAESKRAEAARARRLRSARGAADRLAGLSAREEALSAEVAAEAPLRAAADRLAALETRAAQAAAAAADRGDLVRKAEIAEAAAARALATLQPAGAAADWSPPDLSEPERAHLAAAADRHAELTRELSQARKTRRAATERSERLAEQLADLGPAGEGAADALAEALTRAAALPDPIAAAAKADRAAARLDERIAAGLARLRGFAGDAAALAAAPLPADETVDRFAADRADRAAAVKDAAAALARCESEAERVRADFAALAAGGAVPSSEELRNARDARDAAWERVRDRLAGGAGEAGETEEKSPAALIAAQERATAEADRVADALRDDAARVKEAALLRGALARQGRLADDARGRLERAEAELAALDEAWAAEWAGLTKSPRPPAEMRDWLHAAAAVRADHAARLALIDERADAEAEAGAVAATLAARLAEAGAAPPDGERVPLSALRERAERVRKRLNAGVGRREVLEADREDSEKARRAAAAAEEDAAAGLAAWAADWAAAARPLGLTGGGADAGAGETGGGGPDPAGVRAFLNGWGTVQKHRADAAEARDRVRQIDAALTRFAEDAAALAADLAPDLPAETDPAAAVRTLSERAAAAATRAAELRDLPGRIREARADLDAQRAGEAAGAFLDAARAGDPDELAARADALEAEADDLDRRRDAAIAAVRDAEAALEALDTRGAAAASEQRAQGLLADLDGHADRFARLALADALLAAAAERHRRRHQGPVLAKAGALFARLTGGAFAGLDVRFEGGDEPALVGVRPAVGEAVPATLEPAGMSDGTRDALYLSLRLAGLAETAAGRPIPPLIVDDVLERFDDARTAAALAALAELAAPASSGVPAGVQVILFTHHGRVAELAAALPPGRSVIHRLPTAHLPGGDRTEPVPAAAPPTEAKREPTPAARRRAKAAAEDTRQKALL